MTRKKSLTIGAGGDYARFLVNEFEMGLLTAIKEAEGFETMAETFRLIVREAAKARGMMPSASPDVMDIATKVDNALLVNSAKDPTYDVFDALSDVLAGEGFVMVAQGAYDDLENSHEMLTYKSSRKSAQRSGEQ